MAKNPSHLTLVRKGSPEDGSAAARGEDRFEIVALSDLGIAEQKRIEKTVAALVPNAPILGVQVTARPWDIRPVVMAAREGVPSIIRFAGPEVTLSTSIATRVQEHFERISAFENLARASLMNEWGLYDGQLWYRRPVVESTLAQALGSGQFSELADSLSLARLIISKLEEFHARGVAHGHLTLSNIFVSPYGDVALLDASVGLAISQAALSLGLESSPRGYPRQSFAPETLNSESLVFSSDVFGLGIVLQGLFSRFAEPVRSATTVGQRPRNQLALLLDVFEQMSDENPARRPSLSAVKELLGSRGSSVDANYSIPSYSTLRNEPPSSAPHGRTVKVRRGSGGGREGSGNFPLIPPLEDTRNNTPFTTSDPSVESARTQREPDVRRSPQSSYIQPSKSLPATTEADIRTENKRGAGIRLDREVDEVIESDLDEPARGARLSNRALFALIGLVGLVVGGLFYFRSVSEPPQYSRQELELWWMSKRPSMMSNVALAAIDREHPDKFAEMLVVAGAMRGEQVGSGVDSALIRIAFDERWERDLEDSDRRLALALALSSLLREKTPRDLPTLESAHPGVILSIMASAGDNVGAILSKIPASVLGELPPPLGPAFVELGRQNDKLTCGDETTRSFARLATRGVEDSEQLMNFVSHDTMLRLRALALLYSTDSASARRVLEMLLHHPNVELNHEVIKWAKTWKLMEWEEMAHSDQLALLGGIPPSAGITPQNLGKLFSHSQPSIRGYAIRRAVDQIKFNHPGAYPVLRALAEQPEVLSPGQTVQLAQILESNDRANAATVRAWLETNPPKEIITTLLVATSREPQPTSIDFEFSRYLQTAGWDPKLKDLEKLITHPDSLTRFFAYTKIYALTDKEVAFELLKEGLEHESDPEFRKRLDLMISSLRP